MELLKLVIVDDEPIILRGLLDTYHWEEMGFCVVGSAANGYQALEVIEKTKPDMVLTDICMKQITGLMLMEQVKESNPEVLFVVVSAYRDFEYAQKACEIGAFSYLLKPIDEEKLKVTMQAAYDQCQGYKQQQEEHENWQKILLEGGDNFLPVLVQKYLQNHISEDKAKEVFELLEHKITQEDRYVALCVDIDIAHKIVNPLDYEAERFSLFKHLEEVFRKQYQYWSFDTEKGNRVFLLCTNTHPGPIPVKNRMEQEKRERSANLVSAISKEYRGFEALKHCYNEVLQLFEVASISGAGAFTLNREWTENVEGKFYSSEAEAVIINGIRKNDENQLKMALVEFLYLLPKEERLQVQYFHRLMLQVEFALENSYGKSPQIQESFQNFYSSLEHLSAAQLVDISFTLLCKVIEERRRCQTEQEVECFSDYMADALSYMEKNIGDEELSVVSVATHIYLNPVYFGRVFKNIHKMTFKQYVLKKRMGLAKQLILEGNDSITVIGEKVGIPNSSYFTQVFKQYTGKLPSEYKKEYDV